MNPFKRITHLLAVAAAALGAFMLTPAGQALLAQYPHAAAVLGAIGTIFALYHSPKAVKMIIATLLLTALTASAQGAAGAKKPTHALVVIAKIAAAPAAHPKRTAKDVLGSVLFGAENIVDVVHGGFAVADRAFDAIGPVTKVPAIDAIYAVVSVANTDSGKLDSWLERQEQFLFGKHN